MDVNEKLDEILRRIEGIEEHLNIKPPKSKYKLKPLYTVEDAAKFLGCSKPQVRKYLQFGMLKKFRVGHRVMVESDSMLKVFEDNRSK